MWEVETLEKYWKILDFDRDGNARRCVRKKSIKKHSAEPGSIRYGCSIGAERRTSSNEKGLRTIIGATGSAPVSAVVRQSTGQVLRSSSSLGEAKFLLAVHAVDSLEEHVACSRHHLKKSPPSSELRWVSKKKKKCIQRQVWGTVGSFIRQTGTRKVSLSFNNRDLKDLKTLEEDERDNKMFAGWKNPVDRWLRFEAN